MPRALSLPRLAARLAVVLPFAAFFQAACGGSDTIPFDSDGEAPDAAMMADGSMMMDSSLDSTADDGSMDGTMGDGAMNDGSSNDGASSDANDGSSDAADAMDASDAMDAADASDALDAMDAGDASTVGINLGSAALFTVFAGGTVTNANITTIDGDLGTYPSTTAIGVTPPILLGASAYDLGDTLAGTAATDLLNAYNNLLPANVPGCTLLQGQDLGGKTLAPGVYCYSTSAQLTGALVLDSGGNPNAQWIFQIGTTLTTAALSTVTVVGASPCNVAWQIGTSATLGTGTLFDGNILAHASITMNTSTSLSGRALAIVGSVTMDTNTVSLALCPAVVIQDAGMPDADAGDAD